MYRIGIFGGSFNPIHIGHLIFADRFVEQMNLDVCLFVPTRISPNKANDDTYEYASSLDRYNMICRAIEGNEKFIVDDFELKSYSVSYTINTIEYLKKKYPDSELFLLIGGDQLSQFTTWKDWEKVLDLVELCVIERANENYGDSKIPHTKINAPLLEISSTAIRERIKSNLSIKYLSSQAVEEYISHNALYFEQIAII